MKHRNLSFREACAQLRLDLPSQPLARVAAKISRVRRARRPVPDGKIPTWTALEDAGWQEAAQTYATAAQEALWSPGGKAAQEYLHARGFTDETLKMTGLGYNARSHSEQWGCEQVYLAEGIIIPWHIDGAIWRINIRCLGQDSADKRYIQARGGANGLYRADTVRPGCTVLITEGEFNALSVLQTAGDLVVPVAIGSAQAARLVEWVGRLVLADFILLAFDGDEPGDAAATWWKDKFWHSSKRLRPTRKDISEMLKAGDDIRQWIADTLP